MVNCIDGASSRIDLLHFYVGRNFSQIATRLEHFATKFHLAVLTPVSDCAIAHGHSEYVLVLIVAEAGVKKSSAMINLFDRHACELDKLVRIGVVVHSELIEYLITLTGRSQRTYVGVCELVYDWDSTPLRIITNAGYIDAFVWLVSCFNHLTLSLFLFLFL